MKFIGIVGSEASKFTKDTEAKARSLIREILTVLNADAVVSGACHLGGIDIWAAEIGREMGITVLEYPPETRNWEGYKARNLQIVDNSTEVHCITVAKYPDEYKGMKFTECYHCGTSDHVKSGGCWTAMRARRQYKIGMTHVIS